MSVRSLLSNLAPGEANVSEFIRYTVLLVEFGVPRASKHVGALWFVGNSKYCNYKDCVIQVTYHVSAKSE